MGESPPKRTYFLCLFSHDINVLQWKMAIAVDFYFESTAGFVHTEVRHIFANVLSEFG